MASKCRKFVPNIFNRSKCQNCFGAKDCHSAEALENNKASRKISKCGYLFVSPDFDFANPLDRTRRWQRRFFVLYDDAELTFSVDENPDTIPQGVIDMNKCTDVLDAEKSTSHSNSLAIVTSEKTYYIKGNSKEEIQWWHDILIEFPLKLKSVKPRKKSLFNNKENVQPDALKGQTIDEQLSHGKIELEKLRSRTDIPSFSTFRGVRSLKHKYDKNYQDGLRKSSSLHDLSSEDKELAGNFASSRFLSCSGDRLDYVSARDKMYPLANRSKTLSDSKYSNPFYTVPPIPPSTAASTPKTYNTATCSLFEAHPSSSSSASSTPRRGSLDDRHGKLSPSERSRRHRERSTSLKDFGGHLSLPPAIVRSDNIAADLLLLPDDSTHSETLSADETESNETDELKMARSSEFSAANRSHSICSTPVPDPKGTKFEDLVYMKKGWLIKQGTSDKEARKHWFVLAGNSLRYYKDAKAEDANDLDGRIDLSTCYEVSELNIHRNYGFKIKTQNGQYTLAAMTSGIRNNWMKAIRLCMDLHSATNKHNLTGVAGTPLSGVVARAVDDLQLSAIRSSTTAVTGTSGEIAFQLVGKKDAKETSKTGRRHHSDVNPGNVSKVLTVKEFTSNLEPVSRDSSSSPASSHSLECDHVSQNSDSSSISMDSIKSSPRSRVSKIPRHHSPSSTMSWNSGDEMPLSRYVEGSDNLPASSSTVADSSRVSKRSITSESSKEEEKRELMRRAKSPSARIKEKTRAAKAPRLHSPPPMEDTYRLSLSSSSKDVYSGEAESLSSDVDEVDMGDHISQDQFHDQIQHDDNLMSGTSSGDDVLVEILETEVESLKDRLELSQHQLAKMHEDNIDLKARLHSVHREKPEQHQPHMMEYGSSRWGQQTTQQYDPSQVQGLKRQLKDNKEVVQKQKNEIDGLKSKLDMSVSKLTGTEKALSEALKDLKLEKDRFMKLSSDWNRRIRSLETQLKDTSSKLDRSRDSLISKERDCRRVENELKNIQQRTREQEREILKLKAVEIDYKQVKDKLEVKEREVSDLKSKIRETEQQYAQVKKEYDNQIQDMESEYSSERDDLENHLEQMKARLCEAHERQAAISDTLSNNMAGILHEKDVIISQLEEKVIESDKKMVDLSEELQAEMHENADLIQSMDALQDDKKHLHDKLEEVEAKLISLQDKVAEFEAENISLRKHLEELRRENTALSERLNSDKLSVTHHQEEKGELQSVISELNKQIQGLQLKLLERFQDINQVHSSPDLDEHDLLHTIMTVDSELKDINLMLLKLRQSFDKYLACLEGEDKSQVIILADLVEDIGRKCQSVQETLKEGSISKMIEGVEDQHEITVDSSADSKLIFEEYKGLKGKFDKAVAELRTLKKEINEMHENYDSFEARDKQLQETIQCMEHEYQQKLEKVVNRVEELTKKIDGVETTKSVQFNPLETVSKDANSLAMDIEKQLGCLEEKLSLIEQSVDKSGNQDKEVSTAESLSEKDCENIVERLKEMKEQLEQTNTKLSDIAVGISAQSEKMDTSENNGAGTLHSKIVNYGKKIESLTSKLQSVKSTNGDSNGKENPGNHEGGGDGNPGTHHGVAIDECLQEIKEKLQEINEQLDELDEESDDSGDEGEDHVTTVEEVREKVASLMEYIKQKTALSRSDWSVLSNLSGQLMVYKPVEGEGAELTNDEKLKSYADKLALESVIISEMAYLLEGRYGRCQDDPVLKEIDSLNGMILLLQQKLETEMRSMNFETGSSVLSSYTAVLAEKIAIHSQIAAVTLDASDVSESDESLQSVHTKVLASEALSRAQLDSHIIHCQQKTLGDLDSVSTHIITRTLVQGELTYALHNIKQKLTSLERADDYGAYKDFLFKQLVERQRTICGVIDAYQTRMIKSLAAIISKEGEEVAVFAGAESVLEEVCSEISSVMERHIQSFKQKVRSALDTETAHKFDMVVNSLRTDREEILTSLRTEHATLDSEEDSECEDIDVPLQSLDTTIENFGQIVSQKAIIRAEVGFVEEIYKMDNSGADFDISDTESQSDCETDTDKNLNVFVKSLSEALLKEAASKKAIVSNIQGENYSDPLNLVLATPSLDYPPHQSHYAASMVREAVFEAQVTYMMLKVKLQHEQEMSNLKQNYSIGSKPQMSSDHSRDSEFDFQSVLVPLEEVLDTMYDDECEVLHILEKKLTQLKAALKQQSAQNWPAIEEQVRHFEETFQNEMRVVNDRHEVHMEVFKQEVAKVEKMWDERERDRESFENRCSELENYLDSVKADHEEEVERMKQDVMMTVCAIRASEEQSETQLTDQVQKLTRLLATQKESYKTFLEAIKKDSGTSKSDLAQKVENQLKQFETEVSLLDIELPSVTTKMSVHETSDGSEGSADHKTENEEETCDSLELAHHEHELELLKKEKEEALAEEMRNTKAALDAMRKAYEEKLDEEKEKYRIALMTMYTDDYMMEIRHRHSDEIEKLREELEQVNMHYSSKCEDYKILELKIHQTKEDYENHIQQLIKSNDNLNSMVNQEIDSLKDFIRNKPSSSNMTTGSTTLEEELFDAQIAVRVKDAELQKLRAQVKTYENSLERATEEHRQTMTQYLQLVKEKQELQSIYNKDTQDLKQKLQEPESRRLVRRTPSFQQRARSPSPQTSTSRKDSEHSSRDVHRRRKLGPQALNIK
ncbi:golgin subfamily A member 4-like isoform X2 [Gigantopelta aegis]|uniref:golgin subfamily A member 4-like isoform X2 n=1 Tax=Gigantopelta aegis TaxID=1735272 RepID=UPI001B88D577|nr:golgin subfamily A member 4-like isoform X2 [Gigantopelta aegis]